ncbi:hypothetical protein CA54_44880 [Symmachiella macrocystis]|uniref:Uncharacterized protein n=1 Tax=Symmachiella macrocystis TaxID=2527985 RepID=A0A5C6BB92_9PLAN|nr:hypothetical protein [Symmachiella macrocystis]TWU09248.1 hypothetical protein CA54_44880 [Symmachiella macrocystis]
MSDEATTVEQSVSTETEEASTFPGSEFDRQELAHFSSDDTEVTANIGKMLTIFFFYSLVAMMCVTLWAWWISSSN